MNLRTLPIPYVTIFALTASPFVILILWAVLTFDPWGLRKKAEDRAVIAEIQADLSTTGAAISDTAATNTAKARKAAGDTRHALAASTDLDSDLSIWSDGLDRVRAEGYGATDRRVAEPADAGR